MSTIEEPPPFVVPEGFQRPRWLGRGLRKHIPQPGRTLEELMERSAGKDGDAWYHPRLSLLEIERIEMETVHQRFEIEGKRKPHLRVYCRQLPHVVGVAKGQMTQYVYVFYANSGEVHGVPITLQELRNKGASL